MLFNLLLLQLIILMHWSGLHCLNIVKLARFNRPSAMVHHKSDLRRFLCLSLRIVTRFNRPSVIKSLIIHEGYWLVSIDRQSVPCLGAMLRIVSWQPFLSPMQHDNLYMEFLQHIIAYLRYIPCHTWISYHAWKSYIYHTCIFTTYTELTSAFIGKSIHHA